MPNRPQPAQKLAFHPGALLPGYRATKTSAARRKAMPKETLTVTDNRTGKSYELPIVDGTVRM